MQSGRVVGYHGGIAVPPLAIATAFQVPTREFSLIRNIQVDFALQPRAAK